MASLNKCSKCRSILLIVDGWCSYCGASEESAAITSMDGDELFIPFTKKKENKPKKDWTKLSSYMNIR